MNSVLVIGASGYIGSRLSYELAKRGNRITALCYPEIPENKVWCGMMEKIIVGDISSNKVIEDLTNYSFHSVIHLVSLDHNESNGDPAFVNSINVLPIWNLLHSFQKKQNLKRFIYFSTVQVYGRIPTIVLNEDIKTAPLNQYALTHLMSENINNYYNRSSKIDCINIRLSNSYGSPYFKDSNCWWLVINELCKEAFLKKKLILKSDGSPLRDFIHYKDIIDAIELIINKKSIGESNNTFNLSSGKTFSILDIAKKIQNIFELRYEKKLEIEFKEKGNLNSQSTEKYEISNSKIKNLGFVPKINISTGINEMFDYFESIK
jgi:UDP-glucose 4-epimerase